MRLETARLTLIAVTREVLEAFPDRDRLAALTGARVPADWPDPELAGLLTHYEAQLAADESAVGFGPWLVVVREDAAVAGSAGFVGKPDDGAIELGYGIDPSFRNRGVATEAADTLVEWAFAQAGVERVLARCDVDNGASIRVLEKIGLRRTGAAGDQLLWRLDWR